jgi:hypothetical protein
LVGLHPPQKVDNSKERNLSWWKIVLPWVVLITLAIVYFFRNRNT